MTEFPEPMTPILPEEARHFTTTRIWQHLEEILDQRIAESLSQIKSAKHLTPENLGHYNNLLGKIQALEEIKSYPYLLAKTKNEL